jgi:hypothetical protein
MAQTAIYIERAILHIVDHETSCVPRLSDLDLLLTPEVRRFLTRQIIDGLEHRNSRTAMFADPPKGGPSLRAMCETLLNDPDTFVTQSQHIATHLFNQLTGRTSPGDLVVCTFCEAEGDQKKVDQAVKEGTVDALEMGDPWLAMLKMDPSAVFVPDRQEENGRWRAVLRQIEEAIASGQELQKCAFVLPPALRKKKKHHLKVLDQQNRRYGVRASVASFFSQNFLQCRIPLNRVEQNVVFVRVTKRWLRQNARDWPKEERARAEAGIAAQLQQPQVDVIAYAQSAIASDEQREGYLETLREEGLEDFSFPSDPRQRRKLTDYAEFEGDEELHIRVRAEAVKRMLHCEQDPATGETVITIRTTQWQVTRGEVDPCQ